MFVTEHTSCTAMILCISDRVRYGLPSSTQSGEGTSGYQFVRQKKSFLLLLIRSSSLLALDLPSLLPIFLFSHLGLLGGGGEGVPQHEDDGVAAEEHLGDVPVAVHRLRLLLACKGKNTIKE